jgi:hypothetical protein
MAMPPPHPPGRGRLSTIGAAFALTARSDTLFVPLLVVSELVALGLTALMVVLWAPAFIVFGILLAIVAPLIVLNVRLKKVLTAGADGPPGAGGPPASREDG